MGSLVLGGGVKSVQRGVTAAGAAGSGAVNVTISAVDMSKSVVIISNSEYYAGGSTSYSGSVQASLTSSTNVKLEHVNYFGGSANSRTIVWQVVEYN